MIKEHSDEANELLEGFEITLKVMEDFNCLIYKRPIHDIARRLMEEVVGFEPMEEVKRSSLRPWQAE